MGLATGVEHGGEVIQLQTGPDSAAHSLWDPGQISSSLGISAPPVSKMGMVVPHSKGFWVNDHERTCAKSPVQSFTHSGCSVNRRNALGAAAAPPCPWGPLTLEGWFSPSSPCGLQAHHVLTTEASL